MNINGGEKILLRLRSSQDESELLDVDEIVGTMLHEYLVHFVVSVSPPPPFVGCAK